jgi:hypothetical protein
MSKTTELANGAITATEMLRPRGAHELALSQLVARNRPQAWRVGANHRDDRF